MSNRFYALWAPAVFVIVTGFFSATAPSDLIGAPPPGEESGKKPKGKPGETEPVDPEAPPLLPDPEPVVTTELFEVSKVGRPNARESREMLLVIFDEVAKRHAVEMSAKKSEENAKAKMFRILERITGPESEGDNLCLCDHGGEFCVVSFPEGAFPRGETTPPMDAKSLGKVAYQIKVKRPLVEGASDPSGFSGDTAAFFGALGVGAKPGLEIGIAPLAVEAVSEPESGGAGEVESEPNAGLSTDAVTAAETPLVAEADPAAAAEVQPHIEEEKIEPKPVVVEEFGRKYEIFTADVTLPKWTAGFTPSAAASEELTKEAFLQGLRNGVTHEFKAEEVRKCPICIGFGRVADNSSELRDKDGKRLCPQCAGNKEVLHKITYEVVWER